MRGVLALAAAISLPVTLADGSEFPQRNLIIFLYVQRDFRDAGAARADAAAADPRAGIERRAGNQDEEEDARRIITTTALAHLEEIRGEEPEFASVYDDVAHHYSQRLAILNQDGAGGDTMSLKELGRYRAVTAELMRVERKTAVRLRNEGRISDEVLRKIEHELDLSETRLALS